MKSQFGEKVYRIALNGGMTCPNRDGKIGYGGCIFCSGMGYGDFAGSSCKTITEQLAEGKPFLPKASGACLYRIFPGLYSTYAPIEYLRKVFTEAIGDPDVKVLAIATRPDCLDSDVLELLDELNQIKPVCGLNLVFKPFTRIRPRYIRRGYPLEVFDTAVRELKRRNLTVIVHVILFLPGETHKMMLETIEYLNHSNIDGIKLQLLHILKKELILQLNIRNFFSDPAFYTGPAFHIPDADEYIRLLTECIQHLRPEIVIHRLTGDGPKDLLIAPLWTGAKRTVFKSDSQIYERS